MHPQPRTWDGREDRTKGPRTATEGHLWVNGTSGGEGYGY